MGGRNGIQTNPVAMIAKMHERWGRDPIEVLPENGRPEELTHHQIEELYFFSSTGITFAGAKAALMDQISKRRIHDPKAELVVTGNMIRKARQLQPRGSRADPHEHGVVPAAAIKKAAVKTTAARTRTKHVAVSPGGRRGGPQPYQESTDQFDAYIEIKEAEGKGRGWFAAQDIPQGAQILAEKPLLKVQRPFQPTRELAVENAFNRLSREKKAHFLTLSPSDNLHGKNRILAIFNANSFAWDADGDDIDGNDNDGEQQQQRSGLFARTSLLNHDCQPNAIFDVHAGTGIGQVRAMVPIPRGTEVTIRYFDDEDWAPARQRQRHLREGWHFDCACATCSSGERETARARLRELISELAPLRTRSSHVNPELRIDDPEYEEENRETTLRNALEYVDLMNREGITGARIGRAYNIAAKLLVREERVGEGLEYLRAAQWINLHCFGERSSHFQEQAKNIADLEAKLSEQEK
ncbi:MAG: hypothetical protein M1821_007949 [Bathelium mastoideum]|nr:MAG: hypothetical protein M1821_007949 [Bathelium mastoideum]